ncbi:MAG: HYR domain-containing protein, partial [Candidatus Zixiibacteriota bacterium]
LGCNPTLPSCDDGVTAEDNCDGPLAVQCVAGDIIPDGCFRSQTFRYSATDLCLNETHEDVTYTWKEDLTDPVLSGVPTGGDLGCNPTLPSCDDGVTAEDNCDGPLAVQCVAGDITGGCNKSQTFTYSAVDACGNPVSQDVTYTWKEDVTDPILSGVPTGGDLGCNPTLPSCDPAVTANNNCDETVDVSCVAGDIIPNGCFRSQTFTYTAEDACGNDVSQDVTYTWKEDLTGPELSCPDDIEVCPNVPVNFTEPIANDNCDGVVPVVCVRSDALGFDEPYPVGTTTITCSAQDVCGNPASCSFTVTVNDNPSCNISEGDGFGVPICAGSAVAIEDLFCGPAEMVSYSWTVDCGTIDGPTDEQCVSWIPPSDGSLCTFSLVVVDANGCTSTCTRDLSVPAPIPCGPLFAPDPLPECGSTGNQYCIGAGFTITAVDVSCVDWNVVSFADNCFVYDAGSSVGPCTFTIDALNSNGCPTSCTVEFECVPQVEFCTFTIGGWGSDCPASQAGDLSSTQPGCVRDHFFASVFPTGVTIGDAGKYTATWTSAAAVNAFLPNGTKPGVFTQNYVNPTSTSAGVLAAQILALTLNVQYSCAGVFSILGLSDECYGDFVIPIECGSKFAGITVDEFLVLANKVVSGQTVSFGGGNLKPGEVNMTATCLNQAFDGCDPFAPTNVVAADALWEEDVPLPKVFGLNQNYPNPFNPSTEINY